MLILLLLVSQPALLAARLAAAESEASISAVIALPSAANASAPENLAVAKLFRQNGSIASYSPPFGESQHAVQSSITHMIRCIRLKRMLSADWWRNQRLLQRSL